MKTKTQYPSRFIPVGETQNYTNLAFLRLVWVKNMRSHQARKFQELGRLVTGAWWRWGPASWAAIGCDVS